VAGLAARAPGLRQLTIVTTRLAVLGSPIAHSKSPALHAAAYEVLGLDWEYGRAEVDGPGLPAFIDGLTSEWRGLSLTMPLKWDVLPLLDVRHPLVDATGAANTVLIENARLLGFNTDVHGIMRSFQDHDVSLTGCALVLGAGATAGSAIAAAGLGGVEHVQIAARDLSKADALGARLGVPWSVVPFDEVAGQPAPDYVINTLPNGVPVPVAFPEEFRGRSVLFDVTYDPWPTPLASTWETTAINGLDMLVHQAVQQVRIFVSGDPEQELPREAEVLAAMRATVGL